MASSGTFVNELYDTSAEIGTTMSKIYLVIAIIIGVIFFVCAIISFMSKPETVTQKINGENVTTTNDPRGAGIMSLVCALIIIGFSYLNFYLTTHSKAYASMEGINTFRSIIR
jgi:hypothetical protein